MKRRTFLASCAAVTTLASVSMRSEASDAKAALVDSPLVYLSPVKSDGQLSSCQAEVWFVMLGADVLVCTATSSWRAQAPRQGNTKTRLWVGDLGVWRRADYQSLPSVIANGSVETGQSVIEAALAQFGAKYVHEWARWESGFRKGLADGSRTMLRYRMS